MAAFNANTNVSYQKYLTALQTLRGGEIEKFKESLIRYICWCITEETTIDAAAFVTGLTDATIEAKYPNVAF